jgi:hypothetical protein
LVNLDPSILVEFAAAGLEGRFDFTVGLEALMVVDRRVAVMVVLVELLMAGPASLVIAFVQRPSISPALFIAHSSKSSEAVAGRAVAARRIRNNGTIDTLM